MNPTPDSTLHGGTDLQVTVIDKTIGNRVETVFIRQLPIKLYPRYKAALQNEPRMVELLCDKPTDWSDTLTIESFEAIIEQGAKLNEAPFVRWEARQQKIAATLPKQDVEETIRMMEVIQKTNPALFANLMQNAGLDSGTSLPGSPTTSG